VHQLRLMCNVTYYANPVAGMHYPAFFLIYAGFMQP